MQFKKVKSLVDDAKRKGGKVLLGGKPDKGLFYPITLVADLTNGNRLVDEEQFGPALPIIRFKTIDEAIALANDSSTGLGGSV